MRLFSCFTGLLPGLCLLSALAHAGADPCREAVPLRYDPLVDKDLRLLYTPPGGDDSQGHAAWIDAIEKAQKSIRMTMFHLSDPAVINALKAAAKRIDPGTSGPGGGVHLLMDWDWYHDPKNQAVVADLQAAGVEILANSPSFSITHVKSMVIDDQTAFVTAMNMTTNESWTRDFGVVTKNKAVIREFNSVFASDRQNRDNTGCPVTPRLNGSGSLLWSPVNSEDRLVDLINSAQPGTDLLCSTESFTDQRIEAAFACASKRGVNVKLLAPQCDENPKPLLNLALMEQLNKDAGKKVAFVAPGTGQPDGQPYYIHSKMCLTGYDPVKKAGGTAFVGSVNLSTNSTQSARELGIVFRNDQANRTIYEKFNHDLSTAVDPSAPNHCPAPKPRGPPPPVKRPPMPQNCSQGEGAGGESGDGNPARQSPAL